MADKTIVIDLSAPARVSDLPAMARAFWAWWLDELKAMMPRWFSSFAPPVRPRTRLFAHNGVWRLDDGSGAAQLILDSRNPDHILAEEIIRHGGSVNLSRMEVLLARKDALLRKLELPTMPEAQARAAIELQIDRLTPFEADAVRFAFRTIARDAAAGKQTVEVAIIPLAKLESLESRLHGMGIGPARIDVEGVDGAPSGFDLRKPPSAEERRRRRIIDFILASIAVAAWLLAVRAWTGVGEGEIADWQSRIAELRPAAERTAALRRRVEALAQPFAVANAQDPARTLSILAELTRVLPNDVRVLELRLDGEKVEVAGVSAGAPQLIGKLEASALFKNAKFTSPVIRASNSAQDRFEIVSDVEGEGSR